MQSDNRCVCSFYRIISRHKCRDIKSYTKKIYLNWCIYTEVKNPVFEWPIVTRNKPQQGKNVTNLESKTCTITIRQVSVDIIVQSKQSVTRKNVDRRRPRATATWYAEDTACGGDKASTIKLPTSNRPRSYVWTNRYFKGHVNTPRQGSYEPRPLRARHATVWRVNARDGAECSPPGTGA